MDKPVVFIHTNEQQMLGAVAAAHSFRRQTCNPSARCAVWGRS
jgi:hypothetical protein